MGSKWFVNSTIIFTQIETYKSPKKFERKASQRGSPKFLSPKLYGIHGVNVKPNFRTLSGVREPKIPSHFRNIRGGKDIIRSKSKSAANNISNRKKLDDISIPFAAESNVYFESQSGMTRKSRIQNSRTAKRIYATKPGVYFYANRVAHEKSEPSYQFRKFSRIWPKKVKTNF